MQRYNRYKYAASILVVSTILAGCLNSESQNELSSIEGQAAQAQATIYAQGLQAYATLAQGHITSDENWKNGNTSITQTIDLSTSVDYQYNGALAESIRTGYCRVNASDPQRIHHVTWVDQQDSDGNFIIGGVGHNGGHNIVRKLADFVSSDNLGTFSNGAIKTIGDTGTTGASLPSHCSFDIPNGSPVLIFEMVAPEPNTALQDFTEYKTISCDAGEIGHKTLSLTAKKDPNGFMHIGGAMYAPGTNLNGAQFDSFWNEISSNCREEIRIDNVNTVTTRSDAVDMSAMISATANGQNIVNTVEDNIGQINCRETHQVGLEAEEEVDEFSTCSTPQTPKSLGEIDERELRLHGTEDQTVSCKREENEQSEETHLSFVGTLTLPDWSGEEAYQREIMRHALQDDLDNDDERDEAVLFKDSWVGVSVECERPERLTISCATARPGITADNNFINIDNRGFVYDRNATISGWKDPETYERNDTQRTNWVHVIGESGCAWREERTDDVGCPIGQNGTRTETYRREFIEDTPRTGSWSEWTMISSVNTCQSPSSGSGGNDNGGPGGSSCLLAGTRVLMSDGSEKAIEDVRIGDITACGRVLQTYARNYNNGAVHTSEGIFLNNGGLLEFDGIEATGRHPLYLDNKWYEMGDNPHADVIIGTIDTIVYNLLTEDHIIPVIGESGTVYAFSDDLNNIHDTAEKGRIKNISLFTNRQQKIA